MVRYCLPKVMHIAFRCTAETAKIDVCKTIYHLIPNILRQCVFFKQKLTIRGAGEVPDGPPAHDDAEGAGQPFRNKISRINVWEFNFVPHIILLDRLGHVDSHEIGAKIATKQVCRWGALALFQHRVTFCKQKILSIKLDFMKELSASSGYLLSVAGGYKVVGAGYR